jgi:hypothetical protein
MQFRRNAWVLLTSDHLDNWRNQCTLKFISEYRSRHNKCLNRLSEASAYITCRRNVVLSPCYSTEHCEGPANYCVESSATDSSHEVLIPVQYGIRHFRQSNVTHRNADKFTSNVCTTFSRRQQFKVLSLLM